MDAALFARIISDKNITNMKKIKYKYPAADIHELIALLQEGSFQTLPLWDFAGRKLVFLKNVVQVSMSSVKLLLTPQNSKERFGIQAMGEEITSSMTIEDIDFSRDSVRKILQGFAPSDEQEERIFGMKKGLEFISNRQNKITKENIHTLYQLAIGGSLAHENDKLLPDHHYRHDSVYIVGLEVEHSGLPHEKLPGYMAGLIDFANTDSVMNDLLKAAVIHFYIAYIHPYFDGNGRMARLVHLWYLVQQGYSSTLFVPFSSHIEKTRRKYYDAYTITEQNRKLSGVLDVTPFLVYFVEHVYNKLDEAVTKPDVLLMFKTALENGVVTEKEKDLWYFSFSAYGSKEFSTKQLERDFAHAAYATIRAFVLKFEKIGLLTSQKYGNRVKYRINLH